MPSLISGLGHSRGVLWLGESTLPEPPHSPPPAQLTGSSFPVYSCANTSTFLALGFYLWPQSPLSSPSLCTMRRPEGSASSRASARSFPCCSIGEACLPGNPTTTQEFLPGLAYLNLRTTAHLAPHLRPVKMESALSWTSPHTTFPVSLSFLSLFWFP